MKIEIVSHCWKYSRLLQYQLSSLALFPPQQVAVVATVFCAPADQDSRTWEVLDAFQCVKFAGEVVIRQHVLPLERLLRRAIGRNLAARATDADWLWFADCDTLFRAGALDSLAAVLAVASTSLVYPQSVMCSIGYEDGERAIQMANQPQEVLDVTPAHFAPRRYTRAIGGVQIADAKVVKSIGYCPQRRWQHPAQKWSRTYDDVEFRRQLGTEGTAIEIPNVFRIRHARCGRFDPSTEL